MKTWIDWMSRIAGGMLFQGGYITSPTMLSVGRPAPAAGDAHRHKDDAGARGPVDDRQRAMAGAGQAGRRATA